jgi:hypothetical protein
MSEKKVVGRNVAIALGIVCIILGASVVGTTIYFTSTVNDRDSTINQKDSVIADLNGTVNLRKYTVWVNNETVTQEAGNYTSWTFTANVAVAGYIVVRTTSTTNNAYVRVIYNASIPVGFTVDNTYRYLGAFHIYGSDNQITVSSWTTQNIFPVLPWLSFGLSGPSVVEIRVGNTNTVGNATETVLVTYYY